VTLDSCADQTDCRLQSPCRSWRRHFRGPDSWTIILAGGRQASGSEVVRARSGASPPASEQRSARRRASGNDVQFAGQRHENDPDRTISPAPRILNRSPSDSNNARKRRPRQNPSCWPALSTRWFVSSWSNPQWYIPNPRALALAASSVRRATTSVAIATATAVAHLPQCSLTRTGIDFAAGTLLPSAWCQSGSSGLHSG